MQVLWHLGQSDSITDRKYLEYQGMKTYLVEGGLNQTGSMAKGWWGMLTDDLDGDLGMKYFHRIAYRKWTPEKGI